MHKHRKEKIMKKHGYIVLGAAAMLLSGCVVPAAQESTTPNVNPTSDVTSQDPVMQDFVGLSFEDKTVTYNGEEQKIELAGELPTGAEVSYGETGNTFTDAGEYDVTVTVTCEGYNTWTKQAKLTINKADLSGVTFADLEVDYDGQAHTIVATGVPADATFEYVGTSSYILPGTYTISAKVTKANYNDLELSATLKIKDVAPASEALVVDDFEEIGDSDLASDWELLYYNNGWVTPSTASIKVAKNQMLGSGEQTMRFNVSHQGAAFKATKTVTKPATPAVYKGFAIDAMSDAIAGEKITLKVQLWLKDLPLPEAYKGYKDTYITYTVADDLPTNWSHYEIPFDDASVSIAGGAIPTAALSTLGLNFDMISLYIDKVAVLVTPKYMDGGPKAYAYVDNIALTTETTKKAVTTVGISGRKYTALSSNGTVMQVTASSETACKIESLNLEQNFAFNGTYAVSGSDLVVTIPTGVDKSIVFTLKAKFNGSKLAVAADPTGDLASFATVAEHFQFTAFDEVKVVDNFDGYEATGQGLDRNHKDITQVSGLRAAYYGEVYNDQKPASGVIDANWSLINDGSWTNYIKLETTGKSGKAMSVTNNADWQTRYMNMNLMTGTAQPLGRGNALSFFVKGSVAQTMKIRVYYENKITANNQTATSGNCAYKEGIAVTTGWTQVTVPLEANREVFGVMITPTKANGTIYLDEFELIGAGNPHAEYVAPSQELQYTQKFLMDFQGTEYVADSEIPYDNWTKERYESSWVTSGKMYCKKSNSTNKFINFYCEYGYTYRYQYTLPEQQSDIDYMSIKYANDFSGADIKIKIALILSDDSALYVAGDANNYVTIPAGTGDRMNDAMIKFEKGLDATKTVKGIRYVVNCAKNGDAYFYIDDVTLGTLVK